MSFTVRFSEDLLLFSNWFIELIRLHFLKDGIWNLNKHPIEIKSHVRTLDNHEIDLMISDGETVVVVELKKYDMETVIKQALARRRYANYIYIALDLPTYFIINYLKKHPEVIRAGIGIISARDNCIVIRAYPQKRKKPVRNENNTNGEPIIRDLLEINK